MSFSIIKVAGKEAIATLNEYRSRYPSSGQYPFLFGDADDLLQVQSAADYAGPDFEEIIQASYDIVAEDLVSGGWNDPEEEDFTREPMVGEWPGEISEKGSITLHTDILNGEFKAEVLLGLANIEQPWHLPALLKYGGWNDCPNPEVHCAFHRHWQLKYGAEITGMSGDVVECRVANPPTDRAAALALATEQYSYCYDIVEQGCNTINNLAATIINSPYWYFWWD